MTDARCETCGRWECGCGLPPVSLTRIDAARARLAAAFDGAMLPFASTADMQRVHDAHACYDAACALDANPIVRRVLR
jgi:hypothetical protein